MHKKIHPVIKYLEFYSPSASATPVIDPSELLRLNSEISKLNALVQHLRRQLTLKSVTIFLLTAFQERVSRFFPRFKLNRLEAREKLYCLKMLEKFVAQGGLIKDFAEAMGRSIETLTRWKKAYQIHGLAGLTDKTTRPSSFGNKIPLWIKEHLIRLFLKFPVWTPYQYHSYLKHNPATHWYISLPTIKKIKDVHTKRSAAEDERIKKRWCFAPGTEAWTVDFTCILKTDHYKLQLFTVSDARSRYVFESVLLLETSTELVINHLENLFLKYGKPDLIKADNGPEFRMNCREMLRNLCVHLLNSSQYYGQFCGAHERLHRTLKTNISSFETHKSLTRLVQEINLFREEYNYEMPQEYLEGATPAETYYGNKTFVPKGTEIIKPYRKEGQLRMKFKSREGKPARISIKEITTESVKPLLP